MSMEDPFFVVKGEVQKAVNAARSLHQRWSELLQDGGGASKEEVDWTTNELRNSLRSIEWDLEDLDETISIVESNPKKFNLDAAELSKRKLFITSTRTTVKEMKEQMSSPTGASADKKSRQVLLGERGSQGPIWQPGADRYGRLDNQLQSANSNFIEEQQVQQQDQSLAPPSLVVSSASMECCSIATLMTPTSTLKLTQTPLQNLSTLSTCLEEIKLIAVQQEEQLELVSGTIGVLKNMSERIGMELDDQAVMLDDFGHEMDSTQSRLDNVMKKLAKVSHMTSDRRQWCAIGVLLAILMVIILLFIIL